MPVQVWAAIRSSRGPLEPTLAEWVRTNEDAWLPFAGHVARRHEWLSADRTVALFSWDNGQNIISSDVATTPDDGALTLTGHVLDSGKLVDADALAVLLDGASNPSRVVRDLGGLFSVCRIRGDGAVEAWVSRGRLHSVFHADGPNVHVLASRPHLAHLLARQTRESDYSDEFAAQLLASGLTAIDCFAFDGVTQLPDGHSFRCDANGVVVEQIKERPTAGHVLDVSDVASALIDSVAFLRNVDTDLMVSLSGGKDSRLVVALLSEAGVPFRATSHGFPDHPDVVLAAKIASHLGVEHHVNLPGSGGDDPAVDLGQWMAFSARASDASLSGFDGASLPWRPGGKKVQIGGAGGEVLRGGSAVGDEDSETLTRKVKWQMAKSADLLIRSHGDAVRGRADAWLDDAAAMAPPDALAWYHRDIRLGRWNMSRYLQQSSGRPMVQPLLDSQVIRLAMRMPIVQRADERAFFAVLEAIDPVLAAMPLATSPWKFASNSAPLAEPSSVYNWRTHLSGPVGQGLFEMIEASPSQERLFTVVDADQFAGFAAKARQGGFDGREVHSRFLWCAASLVRVWDDEWAAPATGPVVSIAEAKPGAEPQ